MWQCLDNSPGRAQARKDPDALISPYGAFQPLPGNPSVQPCQLALEKCDCNLGRCRWGREPTGVQWWSRTSWKPRWGLALRQLEKCLCTEKVSWEQLRESGLVGACCRVGIFLLLGWRSGVCHQGRWLSSPGPSGGSGVCSEGLCLGTTTVPGLQGSPCNKTLWELGKWEPQSVISALKRCCLSLLSLLGLWF